MSKNPAFGKWSQEETNWDDKDTEFVKEALGGKTIQTSYEELSDEYETSITN